MKGPLEYVGRYRWFNPSFYPSLCPYIHGKKAFRSTRIAAFYAHSIKVNSPLSPKLADKDKPSLRGQALIYRKHCAQSLSDLVGVLTRYANIDNFLKTSSPEEENILGNVALSGAS